MDGRTEGFQLVAEKVFDQELAKLQDIPHIEEALGILEEALWKNPTRFKVIPGTTNLRIAKTEDIVRGDVNIPSIRIYFILEFTDDCKYVKLKYIETIKDDFPF